MAVNAVIKKQMNEVYVKLMAGKKGFKIPPEVEEILLKNLQDTLKFGAISIQGSDLPPLPKEEVAEKPPSQEKPMSQQKPPS